MKESEFAYILSLLADNANDALDEAEQNENDDFYAGRKFAYYEVLDTIKQELLAREQDLGEFGLDMDLEQRFL